MWGYVDGVGTNVIVSRALVQIVAVVVVHCQHLSHTSSYTCSHASLVLASTPLARPSFEEDISPASSLSSRIAAFQSCRD